MEMVWLVSPSFSPLSLHLCLSPGLCPSQWACTLGTCPHVCLWRAAGALGMDLHACSAHPQQLGGARGIWTGAQLGPFLGTCFFWALMSCNLESNHGLSSQECTRHVGDWCVCPSLMVFLQLRMTVVKEGEWEDSDVKRVMADEHGNVKNNREE